MQTSRYGPKGAKKHGWEVANALDLTSVSLWFARAIADMHQLTHPTFPSDLDGKDKRNRAARPRRSRSVPVSLDQKHVSALRRLDRLPRTCLQGTFPLPDDPFGDK